MHFFFERVLADKETFLWTDAILMTFENPLSEKQRFTDLIECLNDGHDRYGRYILNVSLLKQGRG